MAEKIYMIPVNDAFDSGSECPVCSMYQKLEDDAVDFMIGSEDLAIDAELRDGSVVPIFRNGTWAI